MASKVDPIAILAAFNAATNLAAMLYDAYQNSGATPEEVSAARAKALGRLGDAIAGVATAEPPPVRQ